MGKIAMLTGGGDCPGLNAVISAATRTLEDAGLNAVGLTDGWKGAIEGTLMDLDRRNTAHIIGQGGTILGTSRTNPYKKEGAVEKIKANFKKLGLDALIAIGGEDTLGVATKLYEGEKLPVVGVPKTIDNDLSATDFTFGFDTAVNIAVESVDRIQTTAASHHRVIVVEVMGRHAGWIAAYAGIGGDADVTLVPEMKVDIEEVCKTLQKNRAAGRKYNIVVASEGATFKEGDFVTQETELDSFGHVHLGGLGDALAKMIEKRTGYETRAVVLGHLQRGGSPTAFDRMLGTRFGVKAAQMVIAKDYGKMAALRGNEIVAVPLKDATGELKVLNDDFRSLVKLFSK
jgi:6-phosphofructokinase 1